MRKKDVFDRNGIPHAAAAESLIVGIHCQLKVCGRKAIIGDEKMAGFVKHAIDNGIITKGQLPVSVHRSLCQIGKEVYLWHRADPANNDPEHLDLHYVLGYALEHGSVSPDEAELIHFDMGETVEKYKQRAEGLLEDVIRQLRDGTAFERPIDMSDVRECC